MKKRGREQNRISFFPPSDVARATGSVAKMEKKSTEKNRLPPVRPSVR